MHTRKIFQEQLSFAYNWLKKGNCIPKVSFDRTQHHYFSVATRNIEIPPSRFSFSFRRYTRCGWKERGKRGSIHSDSVDVDMNFRDTRFNGNRLLINLTIYLERFHRGIHGFHRYDMTGQTRGEISCNCCWEYTSEFQELKEFYLGCNVQLFLSPCK